MVVIPVVETPVEVLMVTRGRIHWDKEPTEFITSKK